MKRFHLLTLGCLLLTALLFCVGCGSTVHEHQWIESSRQNAGCTENGKIQYQCECGAQREEPILSQGHSYEITVLTYATKTKGGSEQRVCSACGISETVDVPAIGEITGALIKNYITLDQPFYYVFDSETVPAHHLKYAWSVNGFVVCKEQTYLPQTDCLEKNLTLTITDHQGTTLASQTLFCSKLPVMYIETLDRTPITSKTEYLPGAIAMQGCTAFPSESTKLYQGQIEIRGRGNSTWNLGEFKKKAYKIKLEDSFDLFGFGKSKHWILLANFIDESQLRNTLAYEASQALGLTTMESTFVDVILNGEHVGIYQLCEQIKVDEDRVNLHSWENAAEDLAKAFFRVHEANGMTKEQRDRLEDSLISNLSWISTGEFIYGLKRYKVADYITLPPLTGGLLIEMSEEYDEISKFKTTQGVPIMFKDPEYLTTNDALFAYAKNYIQLFEDALYSDSFTATQNGVTYAWRDLCDLESAAKFWLVSDFFSNEIGYKSTYMYLDVNGKLVFGPVWDFDFGVGSDSPWGTQGEEGYRASGRRWFSRMMQDPEFVKVVYEIYPQFRAAMEKILQENGSMDQYYVYLKEAAHKNDKLWPNPAKWNSVQGFEDDYVRLRQWLTDRIEWFDKQFTDLATATESMINAAKPKPKPEPQPPAVGANDRPDRLGVLVYDSNGKLLLTRDKDTRETVATLTQKNGTLRLTVNVYSTAAISLDLYLNGTKVESAPLEAHTGQDRYHEFVISLSDLDPSKTNVIRVVANRSNNYGPYENNVQIAFK